MALIWLQQHHGGPRHGRPVVGQQRGHAQHWAFRVGDVPGEAAQLFAAGPRPWGCDEPTLVIGGQRPARVVGEAPAGPAPGRQWPGQSARPCARLSQLADPAHHRRQSSHLAPARQRRRSWRRPREESEITTTTSRSRGARHRTDAGQLWPARAGGGGQPRPGCDPVRPAHLATTSGARHTTKPPRGRGDPKQRGYGTFAAHQSPEDLLKEVMENEVDSTSGSRSRSGTIQR